MSEQQQTDKSSLGQKIECCLKYPFTKLINAITHLLKEFKDAEKLPALFVISIVILSLAVMTYFKNSSELVTIVVYSIAIGC
ncbi:MAG: hypothetical protein KJ851_01405, partial [Nanoarchaeota archaeon]|nr:hypothetical protein [Nanoarchaeota archaeon]